MPLSINAMQFLVHLGYANFNNQLQHINFLEINETFGHRAQKIAMATEKLACLFQESDEELYLNLRVKL